MSQGPENRFIKSIHRKLTCYFMKSNNQYTAGIPDCYYSGISGDLWIEYKYGANKLSALQAKWIKDRRAEGRKVWLIIGNKLGGLVFTNDKSKGTQKTKAEIIAMITGETIVDNAKTKGHSEC